MVRRYAWNVNARSLAAKETVQMGMKRGIHRLGGGFVGGRVLAGGWSNQKGRSLKNGGGSVGWRRRWNQIVILNDGGLGWLGAVLVQSLALGTKGLPRSSETSRLKTPNDASSATAEVGGARRDGCVVGSAGSSRRDARTRPERLAAAPLLAVTLFRLEFRGERGGMQWRLVA